jgi:hypothetical protein
MRVFQVRVGINANLDNLVTDINGRRNIAGAGISLAQRIMSTADERQIMVGQVVYETLRHRERYMYAFRPYHATVKHNLSLPVFQFIDPSLSFLSSERPSMFRAPVEPEDEEAETLDSIPEIIAAYLAVSMKYAAESIKYVKTIPPHRPLALLFWFSAKDLLRQLDATPVHPADPETWRAGSASFHEQVTHYQQIDFFVLRLVTDYIYEQLAPYGRFSKIPRGIAITSRTNAARYC